MKSANATITGAKASDADNLAGRVASFLVQVRDNCAHPAPEIGGSEIYPHRREGPADRETRYIHDEVTIVAAELHPSPLPGNCPSRGLGTRWAHRSGWAVIGAMVVRGT